MSIYAIGDLHLSFSVDKPMDVFGSDWENHAERIKTNWEENVNSDDTVIIVGDISWALKFEDSLLDLDWIHNLPGQKVLIRGNHDLWWSGINKLNNLYDDLFFLQNTHYECSNSCTLKGDENNIVNNDSSSNTLNSNSKLAICGSRGWIDPSDPDFGENDQKIYRRELLRMEMSLESAINSGCDEIIVAIHYPPAVPQSGNAYNLESSSEFTRLFEKYPVKKVVYGHLHGESASNKGIIGNYNGIEYKLVAVDNIGFAPVKL